MSRLKELGILLPRKDEKGRCQLNALINHQLIAMIDRHVPS